MNFHLAEVNKKKIGDTKTKEKGREGKFHERFLKTK